MQRGARTPPGVFRCPGGGGQSRIPARCPLRALTCARLRGGAWMRSPQEGAVGSQPPASVSLSQKRALRRPRPGQGRYGNAGPQQSHPAVPAPSCRDRALRCQAWGRARTLGRVGRASSVLWRSSPRWCTRLRPKAFGRARETRYPRSMCPGVSRRFLPRTPSRQGFPRANITPETGRKGSKAFLPRCED